MKLWMIAALPILALGACTKTNTGESASSALAADTESPDAASTETPVAAVPNDAPTYLAKAGAGDLFEIDSSKAVLTRTKNKDVREFAAMMVAAHTASTLKLKAAAAKDDVKVGDPVLDADQQSALDAIKAATADTVDALYLAAQRKGHAAALALHQNYADNGDKPALKKAAGEIVPVVQKHIDELSKLPAG